MLAFSITFLWECLHCVEWLAGVRVSGPVQHAGTSCQISPNHAQLHPTPTYPAQIHPAGSATSVSVANSQAFSFAAVQTSQVVKQSVDAVCAGSQTVEVAARACAQAVAKVRPCCVAHAADWRPGVLRDWRCSRAWESLPAQRMNSWQEEGVSANG